MLLLHTSQTKHTKMKNENYRKQFSKEEIADAHIIPADITQDKRNEILHEFGTIRRKMVGAMSDQQRFLSAILQLKFQMEDYLKSKQLSRKDGFGYFLKEYINRLQLKNKDFATQIGIEPAELSQFLHSHRKPNEKILVRLEIHANKHIDALLWYKIIEKDKEYELMHNQKLRISEKKFVQQYL